MSTETPLDLKKTVNLPQTGFSQKANLAQTEPARLQKWAQLDLYRLIRRARAGRDKFILHDGPPYANADIHLGTAMNKILKDFIVKSRVWLFNAFCACSRQARRKLSMLRSLFFLPFFCSARSTCCSIGSPWQS